MGISAKVAIIACISTGLASCANYRPLIDSRGVDANRYEADLVDCQRYAEQVSPGLHSLVGAAVGAGLGLALATAAGSRYDRSASGRVGAVAGAASGAARGGESQMDIIRNCLRGRGYSVLQ